MEFINTLALTRIEIPSGISCFLSKIPQQNICCASRIDKQSELDENPFRICSYSFACINVASLPHNFIYSLFIIDYNKSLEYSGLK